MLWREADMSMTGMPAVTIARMTAATAVPPSSFTASAPASFRNRPAFRTASSMPAWYDRNGMSPTTSAVFAARATIRV